MRRGATGLAAVVLLASLAGCTPELPVDPRPPLVDLSGPWTYSTTEMRMEGLDAASFCIVEGMTMEIGPWRADGLTGNTVGGDLKCQGQLAAFTTPVATFTIRGGGNVNQYVSWEFGGPDWRHDGEIVGDTMRGDVKLESGRLAFKGRFLAIRRR